MDNVSVKLLNSKYSDTGEEVCHFCSTLNPLNKKSTIS